MASALCQRHHPGLRKRRTFTLHHPRPTEMSIIRRSVRQIQTRPINRHEPPTSQPTTRRTRARQRPSNPIEQQRHRFRAEAVTSMRDCRLVRQPHRPVDTFRPRQPVRDQRQHIHVRTIGMQRHAHREIRHRPSRQRPTPLLSPTALRNHRIHDTSRKHPHQHPHRHHIRQPTIRLRLQPPRTRHTPKLQPCNTN